jgi:hypothetical protein
LAFDDKGGERSTKMMCVNMITKGKGSIKNFEHTSRGSKLINLIDAFECA